MIPVDWAGAVALGDSGVASRDAAPGGAAFAAGGAGGVAAGAGGFDGGVWERALTANTVMQSSNSEMRIAFARSKCMVGR